MHCTFFVQILVQYSINTGKQCYMDTGDRVRVSVSDSGAGVRFVRIFGDTTNNTWNPTRVSESDTGAGYPTRQKN